jgi:membrane-bound lytic murein transglycosylase D
VKRILAWIVFWSITGLMYHGFFTTNEGGEVFAEGPHVSIDEILESHGSEEPVYGEPSRLFTVAREKYTTEYMVYATFYTREGKWSEFSAPGIPVVTNNYVSSYVEKFQSQRRSDFTLWLRRGGKYMPLTRRILVENGLPGELVCLAMIESGFDPRARSDASALGMWQFMPETARRYGLRVDEWVDERLDIEKSSVAASNYLLDLYERYGSWDLTIAAYNAGESQINQITRRTGSEKFWDLVRRGRFHLETRYHVIKFHAAITIMRDLDGYGFLDVELEAPLLFDRVDVPPGTSLEGLAAITGIPEFDLVTLNPQLIRSETPPDESVYSLKVPVGTGSKVRGCLQSGPIS